MLMKARYIGTEGEPGSRCTTLFGITVHCDQVFDVPAGFENKACINPFVEVIEGAPATEDDAPRKVRKAKPKPETNGSD